MSRLEIERRGEHNESFRPGKSLERDITLLAYNAASAVGANQVSARMRFNSIAPAHINTDRGVSLSDTDHLVREQHFDVGQIAQAIENKLCSFELLALNNEWMICVFLENNVIELRDLLAAWPIPELENGRHQPDARHLVRKAALGQQIERGGMGCGSPRIRLQGFVDVEQPNRQTATSEQPSAQQADRATSGNQYPPFVKSHARKLLSYLFPRRPRQF